MPTAPPPIHQSRFFRIMTALILLLAALFLLEQVDYIFQPLLAVLLYLLTPMLLSLFLYYILRPLVRLLAVWFRQRTPAILCSFLLVLLMISTIAVFGGNVIQDQLKDLTDRLANYYGSVRSSLKAASEHQLFADLMRRLEIEKKLGSLAEAILAAVQRNLFGFLSKITSIGTILVLIPFILFYFLKDDREIKAALIALLPPSYRHRAAAILGQADATLSRYIQGQLIIAAIIGGLTFLGYLLIGLPNSFILAMIMMITSFIPFFGPIIGALPAALIGLAISSWTVVKVLLVLLAVQQLEGNLISPRLQGARLNIHPLMVLLVVIAAYSLFGILGSLFAVPAYVVLRVFVKTFWVRSEK